jgi:ATP-dependent helicase/nuclease subunit A
MGELRLADGSGGWQAARMDILRKNLLILASAGSGKTYQLGNRVIGLVARGADPARIVALTFTRKAAGEFAESVLSKLAAAADDPARGDRLMRELGLAGVDFPDVLERVVRALPRFTLGTMDSFFSKVVRGFQYELGVTGGRFDLLEGPRADAARDALIAELLGDLLGEDSGGRFLHAFRRATVGKSGTGVIEELRDFVEVWQGHFRSSRDLDWGPSRLAEGVAVEDWEARKHDLAALVRRGMAGLTFTQASQPDALEKAITALEEHTIGSGGIGEAGGLLPKLLDAAADPSDGPLVVKHYKDLVIGEACGAALRDLIGLAASGEMAAALTRTRALHELMAVHDECCERRLRRRGRLGFDDVKWLMGAWARSEDARLRREMVDFRLDARYDHWLLDEFQDTSRSDWNGLEPLLNEAAAEGEGTMFIVGDRKQAIYGWRGGEVGLFDEVRRQFGGDLKVEPLVESWRSCPEVLELVNRVCGDRRTMEELFGSAAERWEWEDHVPAAPLAVSEKRGEARVEVVDGGREEKYDRLVSILEELGVGRRGMTCGVLLRSNRQVREVVEHLRSAGFDVIEEGTRKPAEDSPVGIALHHLLKWLGDPSDAFARGVVEMSPLGGTLAAEFGMETGRQWEGLLARAAAIGFAGMAESVVEVLWHGWSQFGRRRAGDLIAALAAYDSSGGISAVGAADWVGRLQVSQNPGVAAVQVMTIHKSKGLGFDVVVLPEVPDDSVPAPQRFEVASTRDWLSATPPKWARAMLPEMRAAETDWSAGQRYEAFCALYVALTRAKRGLYMLLDKPAKSRDDDRASLAGWLARAVGSTGEPGVVWQSGTADWVESVPELSPRPEVSAEPSLGATVPRRERTSPSGAKVAVVGVARSVGGMAFGRELHEAFERVAWVDEQRPILPESDAGRLVGELLEIPAIRSLFVRAGRAVELYREQPVDAVLDGRWLSGVIDRLHVHRDIEGRVVRVEVIDFKTDSVAAASELAERYSGQMEAYGRVLSMVWPGVVVECLLLSTKLRAVVAV